MDTQSILIVEDDSDIVSVINQYLEQEGYSTHIFKSGFDVVSWVKINQPALVLLDLMLPGQDGVNICREIRSFSDVPIIMVTAKVSEVDRLLGLEIGADDYVCKPFSVRELVARVKVILRRLHLSTDTQNIVLNKENISVRAMQNIVDLTSIEFRIFEVLYHHPGRIYSREQLMDEVYNDNRNISGRTVDSHIRNLRKKLKSLALNVDPIQSVYGAGYKYEPV